MTEDAPSNVEEEFEDWLLKHEAALTDSATGTTNPANVPRELNPRMKRGVAGLHLAQMLRPRGRAPWPQSSPVADAPGSPRGLPWTRLGRFELRRELGRGGCGIVFLAYDPLLHREVALKVPRAEVAVTPELRERFHREAQVVAGLDHPNLVPVYEAGEVGPVCFLVSAYCPGITLAQWLKDQTEPVPFRLAADLVATLAEAMQHAHGRGVVHRDLKPANVLLTVGSGQWTVGSQSSGQRVGCSEQPAADSKTRPTPSLPTAHCPLPTVPKITDFGLAKVVQEQGGGGATRTGAVLGTVNYMSPEQAGGKTGQIGPATDVYALGAILYELVTGRVPFLGETDLETLQLVRDVDPVPPSRLRPRLPSDLETVCLTCLHKEPGRRYSDAQALADDLRRFLAEEPIRARPAGQFERTWRWCRRKPLVATLIATVTLLVLFITIGATMTAVEQHRLAQEANDARDVAEAARNSERLHRRHAEELLEREYVSEVVRLMDQGQMQAALPWIVEGLRLAEGDAERERIHRYRFASTLEHCPQMVRAWFHDAIVLHAEFSADGRRVATACANGTVQVWDATTQKLVGRPLLHPNGGVNYVMFSSDGRRVLTSCADRTARIWDVSRGKELTPSMQHSEIVMHAEFSPNDRRVVTACTDGSARQWNADTGAAIDPPLKHKATVRRARYSPDGKRIVTASDDRTAQVWDASTGKPVGKTLEHRGEVWVAVFNKDGTLVATAGQSGARVWDATTGHAVTGELTLGNSISSAAFSPDGTLLATASISGFAALWEVPSGKRLTTFPHEGPVLHIAFSPNGQQVLTGSADRTACLWDVESGHRIGAPLMHSGRVLGTSFNPAGTQVITASEDHTARLWSLEPQRDRPLMLPHEGHVWRTSFSPDGRRILSASLDGSAQIWRADSGQPIGKPLEHDASVCGAVFSPDGSRVATASYDKTAQVWNSATGEPIGRKLQHEQRVASIAFSPDGRRVLTASDDATAQIWNADTGEAIGKRLRQLDQIHCAAFSPGDGSIVATGCKNGIVQIWNAATGEPLHALVQHGGWINSVVFSPDGRHLLTASLDGAGILNVGTGKLAGNVMRHSSGVRLATFSPDGTRVLTASSDRTARVWDSATNELVCTLNHGGDVIWAEFSPDGKRVVTASSTAQSARVWNAATGEPLTPELKHGCPVWCAAFSPDGARIVTGGLGSGRVWELSRDDRPVVELKLVAETLAGVRMQAPGKYVPLTVQEFLENWIILKKKYPEAFPSAPVDRLREYVIISPAD